MKKNDKGINSNNVSFFGKKISSWNFFALLLCFIIGIGMVYRTIYVNKKLSQNTESVVAEIIDIYSANHGQRLWGYEMKYKFILHGKEYIGKNALQKNELNQIQVGDCIEIIVSLEDIKIQKWDKKSGIFNCP